MTPQTYHVYEVWVHRYDVTHQPTLQWFQKERRFYIPQVPLDHFSLSNIGNRRHRAVYIGTETKGDEDWDKSIRYKEEDED
jgi:hypothetical protein